MSVDVRAGMGSGVSVGVGVSVRARMGVSAGVDMSVARRAGGAVLARSIEGLVVKERQCVVARGAGGKGGVQLLRGGLSACGAGAEGGQSLRRRS